MAPGTLLKRTVRAVLRKTGRALVRVEHLNPAASRRAAMMRYHGIQTVLDVGANQGQYSSGLREWGFQGRIISFEPTSAAFKLLSARAAADPQWCALNLAAGAEDGTAEINVASNEGASSSLMPMLDSHRDCAPSIRYVATEQVPVRTLDNAIADIVAADEILMLKMDVQGFEHLVLRGATATLPRVRMIECELSTVPLYGGQLTLSQMLALLETLGFIPVDFDPGFSHPVSKHCLQLDGVFARAHDVSGPV
jgi:FkbM family methyltransferase